MRLPMYPPYLSQYEVSFKDGILVSMFPFVKSVKTINLVVFASKQCLIFFQAGLYK